MSVYFFLEVGVESRHGGNTRASSTRKFDYIARLGPNKDHPSELSRLCSDNMPGWVPDDKVREFWKAVDRCEINYGVLCRSIVFALPTVLSEKQKVAVTEKFIKAVIGDRVHPYTYAIHEINGVNPHCHLIFSERMNDGLDRPPKIWFKITRLQLEDRSAILPLKSPNKKIGVRKASIYCNSGGAKKYYLKTRKLWETLLNEALEKAGHSERVDCRSNKERGILSIQQVNLGPAEKALENQGVRTQKGKLSGWIEKANNKIKSIVKIEVNSNYEHEMVMFMLGETKNWIKKDIKNLSIEYIQEISTEFFREIRIEERTKKDIADMRSEIDGIKEIKETIKCDALEWEKENKRFKFVWDRLKEFESMISHLENNVRKFDEEQKERIEYIAEDLSDYFFERYCEEKFNECALKEYFHKKVKDYLSEIDFDEELKNYRPGIDFEKRIKNHLSKIYFDCGEKNKIIELGEKTLREQYLERITLAKYYKQLKETDAAEKTEQKDDQKRTKVVVVKGYNYPKINELIKERTPHFVESRGELVDGYPSELDRNDYRLAKDGTAKLKNAERKKVDRHDAKQVATTEKIEQKNDKETPEERKERLKTIPIDGFIEEMRKKSNLKDEKPKTDQSKIGQSEQDKIKQPEIKKTKGLEAEQERLAEERRKAEERQREQERLAEERRKAEERQREQERLAEERRKAEERQREQERLAEERRKAEERQREQERLAEERRKEKARQEAEEKARQEAEEKARQEAEEAAIALREKFEKDLEDMANDVEVRKHPEWLEGSHLENLEDELERFKKEGVPYAVMRDGEIIDHNLDKVFEGKLDPEGIEALKDRVKENIKNKGRKLGKGGFGIGD